VLRGRFFSHEDYNHPDTLAVINEAAARRFFPGENAIGKEIIGVRTAPNSQLGQWKTVVGIVSNSKNVGLDSPAAPQAFINGVSYSESTKLQFLIRSVGDQHALETALSSKLR
jgi:macrolide transport system ATP-binding/permease protein